MGRILQGEQGKTCGLHCGSCKADGLLMDNAAVVAREGEDYEYRGVSSADEERREGYGKGRNEEYLYLFSGGKA